MANCQLLSERIKDNPKNMATQSASSDTLTGQCKIYTTKIRLIVTRKCIDQETTLNIHDTVTTVLQLMFSLDSGISTIQSSNNEHLQFCTMENYPKSERTFQQFFETKIIEKRNGDTSVTIYFIVNTTTEHSLNQLKNNPPFSKCIRDNKIHIYEHPFETQDFARIGFLCNKSNQDIHIHDFQNKLKHELCKSIANNSVYDVIPTLAVNTNIVRYRNIARTEALEIECEKEYIEILTTIVINAKLDPKQFGEFIPYTIQEIDPDLLLQLIKNNNVFRKNISPIYLSGIHPDVMTSYLHTTTVMDILLSDPNILSLERTYQSEEYGKWVIITTIPAYDVTIQSITDFFVIIQQTKEYNKHINDNNDYANGITISKYSSSPLDYTSQYLQFLRANTTFKSTTRPSETIHLPHHNNHNNNDHRQPLQIQSTTTATTIPTTNTNAPVITQNPKSPSPEQQQQEPSSPNQTMNYSASNIQHTTTSECTEQAIIELYSRVKLLRQQLNAAKTVEQTMKHELNALQPEREAYAQEKAVALKEFTHNLNAITALLIQKNNINDSNNNNNSTRINNDHHSTQPVVETIPNDDDDDITATELDMIPHIETFHIQKGNHHNQKRIVEDDDDEYSIDFCTRSTPTRQNTTTRTSDITTTTTTTTLTRITPPPPQQQQLYIPEI